LADWGYNRDKKSGKKQVVVGLLCDEQGDPVSIEVFVGKTRDFDTVASQIAKAVKEFKCKRILFVGDRGMIKSKQMAQLNDAEFYYLTAITKPQIEKLLKTGVFQIDWFDSTLCEVEHDTARYILRRNPQRVADIRRTRQEKQAAIAHLCQKKNVYLAEHPRAQVQTAMKEIEGRMARLKVAGWLRLEAHGRQLYLQENPDALAQEAKLDGCYVLKSDAPKDIDKHLLHDRYKDLAAVERAFRTCKTAMLEMRPWYVWSEKSTRGHALVVMLAYLITRYLQHVWSEMDLTVEEGLHQLSMVCSMEIVIHNQSAYHTIPTPDPTVATLLEAAQVRLPKVLPHLGTHVVSRKKLPSRRKPFEANSVPSY
jgi:transposase